MLNIGGDIYIPLFHRTKAILIFLLRSRTKSRGKHTRITGENNNKNNNKKMRRRKNLCREPHTGNSIMVMKINKSSIQIRFTLCCSRFRFNFTVSMLFIDIPWFSLSCSRYRNGVNRINPIEHLMLKLKQNEQNEKKKITTYTDTPHTHAHSV